MAMLGELTTLETRILASLTEPQTSTELFENLGIGYPYGIKVLRKLKKSKMVDHIQRGNYTYYFTIRTADTEELYAARAHLSGKIIYTFPFRGEWATLMGVGRGLAKKERSFPLLELANRTIMNLRYNSYRKSQGLPTQLPDSEHMRRNLETHLQLARMEIQFVEELLKAPVWNESVKVWETISDEPVDMDKGKTNSDQLQNRMYKK